MGQCNYRWCSSPEKWVCEAVCYTKKITKKKSIKNSPQIWIIWNHIGNGKLLSIIS